jgi:hypothetical protein
VPGVGEKKKIKGYRVPGIGENKDKNKNTKQKIITEAWRKRKYG